MRAIPKEVEVETEGVMETEVKVVEAEAAADLGATPTVLEPLKKKRKKPDPQEGHQAEDLPLKIMTKDLHSSSQDTDKDRKTLMDIQVNLSEVRLG
jgi:hypothetical protein